MRVLVAEDNPQIAQLLARMLREMKHVVRVVDDGDLAMQELMSGDFDAAIMDWMMPRVDGLTAIRLARAQLGIQPAIVVVSALTSDEARRHALSVGADEFVPKPFSVPVLSSALGRALKKRAVSEGPKLLPCRIAGCAGWLGIEDAIACAVADATTLVFRPVSTSVRTDVMHAELAMIDVESQTELHVSMLASRAVGHVMVSHMLRITDPDDALVEELLVELCNNVLGRLKTLFRSDGFNFTLGVSEAAKGPAPCAWASSFPHLTSLSLDGDGLQLGVMAAVRTTGCAIVRARDLVESMVLADDVLTASGTLLLSRGTRLTEGMAGKLRAHLPDSMVRVIAREAA